MFRQRNGPSALLFLAFCVETATLTPKSTQCDPLHCAFQTGLNSNDHVFEWFAKNPSVLNDFNIFMSAQREGHEYWLDFYPFEQQIGNASQSKDDTTVLFVDIGGGLGHEIQEIRRNFLR